MGRVGVVHVCPFSDKIFCQKKFNRIFPRYL